ncbi:ABC transporter substrate-binding protein [Paenibacillus vini]|uniref:Alpha-glucoside ABC transporter substrate-binding protein n=1 Tax=Paenibacillus vini TaxID=1476024 RepID=A0ABQ4MD58_9BACL|nr:ABC transporter substrate-binding protein [Paenibacillus vini]GIP53923.1 alpha-glucoside ABC transporter substrate-binding protein [Paenibacillus vini]
MKKTSARKWSLLLVLCLSFTMVLSACGGGNNASKNEPPAPAPSNNEASGNNQDGANNGGDGGGSPLDLAMKGEYKGTKVTMFGPFVDADQVKFENSIKEFEEKTGIDIQYEGSKEFEATINIRVDGGNAPDIADFPQPGLLASIAKTGKVIDLTNILDQEKLKANYNQSWLDMGTMDGKDGKIMAGIWNRSNVKSLVWYPKKQFEEAGYEVPQTWDEMMALTEQIAKDGDAAWNIGIESGAATGWPATDWVEDIMLRTTSPENYDKWVKGELPFTSPEVKHAVEVMSEIWLNKDYVYGGTKSIVTTAFGDAPSPMFDNPPKSWFHRQGNFITSFFPETAKVDVDYDWFYLPPIDEQYGKPVLVAGDIYAMFNDRPEVRAVMEFFTTGESIKTWVQSGGVIAPMNDASLDWYSSESDRRMAKLVQEASTLRFDGSDLMPGQVGAGTFWKGMTDYVSGTATLDKALEQIQAGWKN